VVPVGDGQVVTVGRVPGGLRAYVAVSGGFDSPVVVGSRSNDLWSGLGPGPLVAGDRLDLGPPTRPRGQLLPSPGATTRVGPRAIRIIEGPHGTPGTGTGLVAGGPFTVGEASNRIGVRLLAPDRSPGPDSQGIPSTAMVTGAVQLPPDGNPIILMPDHATVGGYPVVGCVIAADLSVVGQLKPGDAVTFDLIDRRAAHREWAGRERLLTARVTGWFPTQAGT
jgi:allophanate hydrolase subunit 2